MNKSILIVLGDNISADMSDIISKTMKLYLEMVECKGSKYQVATESMDTAVTVMTKLSSQAKKLRCVYDEIEKSDNPERYFDHATISELVVANGYIRGFEKILKAQYDSCSNRVAALELEAIKELKQIRVVVAKLRRIIDDLMSIERQLNIASINKYEKRLKMTSDDVAKLKEATQRLVTVRPSRS
ncbi:hypothetical protein [Vibrio sp. 1CM24A]|uniref:hypothetical protein n=1 Tax=Vibrio sp. 1CM24A TaxID=2929165 RepID=UPI0020BFD765|nr:hypothetical protein [Vibrio sp. 1CM24A]MCK8083535.1 hypothetical protein [Vibrio sp. 1CM24A]CAK1868249.1 conserved hypothetical protein [Vibrio crassostreae]